MKFDYYVYVSEDLSHIDWVKKVGRGKKEDKELCL